MDRFSQQGQHGSSRAALIDRHHKGRLSHARSRVLVIDRYLPDV